MLWSIHLGFAAMLMVYEPLSVASQLPPGGVKLYIAFRGVPLEALLIDTKFVKMEKLPPGPVTLTAVLLPMIEPTFKAISSV